MNASLSTVHGAIANGLNVVALGQDITARAVVAAGAQLQLGQAVANQIQVGNASAFLAQLTTANQTLGLTNTYSSYIDNTLKATANYTLDNREELRGLRQQVNELKALLATMTQTLQQVGIVIATETRTAGSNTAAALGEANDTLRKIEQAA